MHEVKGENHRTAGGNFRGAEHPFQQQIQHRQHQHTGEGAHTAPAKGSHAEEPNAHGENQLAQGRVRNLIGIDVGYVFIRGAGVINFVKIGAVPITGGFRRHLRFVQQRPGAAVLSGEGNGIPLCISENKGPQKQPVVCGQTDISGGKCPGLRHPPGKQHGVFLLQCGNVPPGVSVHGNGKGIAAGIQSGVIQHFGNDFRLRQLQGYAAAGSGKFVKRLGCGGIAQIIEGRSAVNQHDCQQQQGVHPGHKGLFAAILPKGPLCAGDCKGHAYPNQVSGQQHG